MSADAELWLIDRIVPGGDGFARLSDGRAAFARGALPGDTIRPLRVEIRKGYLRALEFELVEASRERVLPGCPVARKCGGCDLIELGLPAQLRVKAGLLREALARTAGLRDLPEPRVVSRGPSFAYRNRVRLHIDERGRLGFFARGTHELVEIPECPVCEPAVNLAFSRLRAIAAPLPRALARFAQVEIRAEPHTPRAHLHLFPRRPEVGAAGLLERLAQEFDVSVAKSAHSSAKPDPSSRSRRAPELQSSSRGVELAVPPEAFRQVNWNINRVLVERVLELVSEHRIEHFIELYAGAGNFTIPLVARGLSGVAVESNAAAADALRARACGYAPRLRVLTGDARRCLAELLAEGAHADLTLLDPPRAGARDVLADLIALAPAHIAICACDPVTLARDLRTLLGAGYELELLEGYDMFPQTHHVEALVWLKRRVTASERPRSPVSDP